MVFLFLSAGNSFAHISEYEGKCRYDLNYDNNSYHKIDSCLYNELVGYQKKLNELERVANTNKDQRLEQIRLLWNKYKEDDCHFWEKVVLGGAFAGPVDTACSIKKIKKRIGDLQNSNWDDQCLHKENYKKSLNCLKKELQKYNEELITLYKSLVTTRMKKAQCSWGDFVKADCAHKASRVINKEESELIHNVCLINRVKERIRELNTSVLSVDWFKDANS